MHSKKMTTKLNGQEKKENEEHFLEMMRLNKIYTWADYGHVYVMSSGKIVPQTWQGFSALSKVVSQKFMDTHVEMDCMKMFFQAVKLKCVEAVRKEDRTAMQLCGQVMREISELKNKNEDVVSDDTVSDFVRQNEMLWNADGPTASFGVMKNPEIWQSWKESRGDKFKSACEDVKKAEEVAKQEAKKADKKAKLLAANAAAKERNRKAQEAIKQNSIDHFNPVSTKITPEQIAAAKIREKERLRQLELEDKAAKKALRELKNKTKGKKVKHC